MTFDDLPQTIPIFPLEGALLLPGGVLPLNIFEERYVRMIDDALSCHRIIGMIQPDIHERNKGNKDAILKIGCMGRITQFHETDNQNYKIMLKGVIRFQIEDEIKNILPYRQAKIRWGEYEDDIVEDCDTVEIDRDVFLPLLKEYFDIHDMTCDWDIIRQSSCETLITNLPMICPFDSQEKQALLEAKTMDNRYETLTAILNMSLNSGRENSHKVKH